MELEFIEITSTLTLGTYKLTGKVRRELLQAIKDKTLIVVEGFLPNVSSKAALEKATVGRVTGLRFDDEKKTNTMYVQIPPLKDSNPNKRKTSSFKLQRQYLKSEGNVPGHSVWCVSLMYCY